MNTQESLAHALALLGEARQSPVVKEAIATLVALHADSLLAHNDAPADPDTHIVFKSVCCAARIYRCDVLVDGLPSKPTIHQGETACRACKAPLTVEPTSKRRLVVVRRNGKIVSRHTSVEQALTAREQLIEKLMDEGNHP
jgi:hypothetical protein